MKRILALVLLIAVLGSSMVFASGQKQAADGLTKVKVAHHMGYSGAAVVAIGTKMGYFQEEGLDVELVPFTSGPAEIAAMVSGDLQFGYIGSGATTLAVKGDVEIIYFQNLGDAEVIVANKDSGIKSVADLKGKSIATTLGTSGENIVNLALERAGLNVGSGPDSVNLINMDMGGCVTAMLAGKIDAVCVWGSYKVTLEQQLGDKYVALAKTSDFADTYASVSSWLATQDYIDANPGTVQAFANALAKSMDYWKDNEKQVATWVAELLETDIPTIESQIGTVFFYNSDELKQALDNGTVKRYYEVQQQSMFDTGKIDNMVSLDEYVQWDYMYNAIANR
ncbi:MAG: ABC transporter substrate-binding protein [Sphaerochaetaceae bacterium]